MINSLTVLISEQTKSEQRKRGAEPDATSFLPLSLSFPPPLPLPSFPKPERQAHLKPTSISSKALSLSRHSHIPTRSSSTSRSSANGVLLRSSEFQLLQQRVDFGGSEDLGHWTGGGGGEGEGGEFDCRRVVASVMEKERERRRGVRFGFKGDETRRESNEVSSRFRERTRASEGLHSRFSEPNFVESIVLDMTFKHNSVASSMFIVSL